MKKNLKYIVAFLISFTLISFGLKGEEKKLTINCSSKIGIAVEIQHDEVFTYNPYFINI